jgi:hypothetical protein
MMRAARVAMGALPPNPAAHDGGRPPNPPARPGVFVEEALG